jgi:tRNA uracil 4-sulfurtransferase
MDKMPPCPTEAVDASHLVVLRYGELFLKGANRGRFEKHLQDNVKRSLAAVQQVKISRGQGRLFVRHGDDGGGGRAIDRLRRVFGLSSLSPAWEIDADLDAIQRRALELVLAHLEQTKRPRSFRIRTRRSDKRFPHNSMEINTQVGSAVVDATGLAVDLTAPELEVGIEIGPQLSFVFLERIPGAGGLPVGTSGRVSLLLSGGIDSPVAGHLMQKRGCVLHPIYFHSFPYTGDRTRAKVVDLAAALRPAQARMTLQVVPFTEIQTAIRDACPIDLAVVLYRRMMMRISSALAKRNGCAALATGENLGQVASQTLDNLACIEQCARLPVLRPLLTYDKTETITLARAIGTYELSIAPYEDSCSLFVPKHPATRAKPAAASRAEEALEIEALVAAAVDSTEQVDVS